MGTLLHSCVEFYELIKLSFGMVSGVGPGIDALDGGRNAARGVGIWDIFKSFPHPINLNGALFSRNVKR